MSFEDEHGFSTKQDHKEIAKEYREGKHSFKHPKNAIKLAEMHEHKAKSKALEAKKGKHKEMIEDGVRHNFEGKK